MGNSGSFSPLNQPVKVSVVRLRCPFQDGVYVNSKCEAEKCPYGLWNRVFGCCQLRSGLKELKGSD